MPPEPDSQPAVGRGRAAKRPSEIPKRGWKEVLLRVKQQVAEDRAPFVAAGVAFYMLIGFVPSLGVVMSLYGLVADPSDVTRQVQDLERLLPSDAFDVIETELTRVASSGSTAGFGALVSFLIAIWGGSKAMDALMTAVNIAYGERDRRSFVRRRLIGLAMTVGAAVFVIIAVALLVVIPAAMAFVGLGGITETLVTVLRWPFLFLASVTALSLLYRFAPYRNDAKWRWISWGSVAATSLWLLGSALFALYTANFGDYNKSYGSLGAIVLLLLWFYLSGFAVILGAELNSEMELQTARDTTVGRPKPIGQRGAYVADNLPPKF